ncbi:putative manganese resistance 1 protein, partial [Toxoplasma gondii TgCatPRC2]
YTDPNSSSGHSGPSVGKDTGVPGA